MSKPTLAFTHPRRIKAAWCCLRGSPAAHNLTDVTLTFRANPDRLVQFVSCRHLTIRVPAGVRILHPTGEWVATADGALVFVDDSTAYYEEHDDG